MMKNSLLKNDGRLKWPALMTIGVVSLVMYACALPQSEVTPANPQAMDVEQVRDPLTGRMAGAPIAASMLNC